jgi:catechol 2,3-dioxygenase-like lactoylglutathione lyase family enzyme
MTIDLNHTIVPARDKWVSARFLAGVLGIPTGAPVARFAPVPLSNGVTLDYMDLADGPPDGAPRAEHAFIPGHYAFLVSDEVLDAALARLTAAGVAYHAQPDGSEPSQLYNSGGGRGFYFRDPDAHLMELFTRPVSPSPLGT